MLRYLVFSLFLFALWTSCDSKKTKELSSDPCLRIEQTLIGSFRTIAMDGSMNFSGGLIGNVDISGRDYNDMVCSYRILDCTMDTLDMICDGAGYKAAFEILSRDSISIDRLTYVREQ